MAGQLGFYAQDKWEMTNNFQLTYGLRMDIPIFFDTPAENAPFNAYAQSRAYATRVFQVRRYGARVLASVGTSTTTAALSFVVEWVSLRDVSHLYGLATTSLIRVCNSLRITRRVRKDLT